MRSYFLNQKIRTLLLRKQLMLALGVSVLIHVAALIVIAALLPVAPSPTLLDGMQIDVQAQDVAAAAQKKNVAVSAKQRRASPLPLQQTAVNRTDPVANSSPSAEPVPSPAAEIARAPVALEPQTIAPVEADGNKTSLSSGAASKITAPSAAAQFQPAQFNAAYLRNPSPRYPAMSRQLQEEGRVEVLVEVSAEGLPGKVSLKSSSGFPRLDKAALDVVQTWRFVPANRGGQPEASTVTVPLVFSLQN